MWLLTCTVQPADPTPEVFRYLKPFPASAELSNAELYSDSHRATEEEIEFHVAQLEQILGRSRLPLPERFVDGVAVAEGYPILSLKLYQIEQAKMRVDDYLTALAIVGAKHLVVLHRSYLRVYISSKMAKETGKFANSNKNQQVNCPSELFTDDWQYRATVWERLDREYQMALTHPAFPNRLALSYESDVYEDPAEAAAMVNEFLGRNGPDVVLQMYRTSDCPIRDAILDYDNLVAALEGTSRAYMLEPQGRQVPLPPVEVTVGLEW